MSKEKSEYIPNWKLLPRCDRPEIGTPVKLTQDAKYYRYKKGEKGIVVDYHCDHLIEVDMGYKHEGSLWKTCVIAKGTYEVIERIPSKRPLKLANVVPDEDDE